MRGDRESESWRIDAWGRGVVAVCVVLAALAYWHREPGAPPVIASAERSVAITKPRVPAPESPQSVAPAVPPRPQAVAVDDRNSQIEVCGRGYLTRAELDSEAFRKRTLTEVDTVLRRLIERLLQGDTRARAAGLSMQVAQQVGVALEQRSRAIGTAAAASAPADDDVAGAGQPLNALAKLAVDSRDPAVYALAVQACQSTGALEGRRGGCQLISFDQWALLDARNAVPWMYAAEAAFNRRDTGAYAEAMHRIAQAQGSETFFGVLPGLARTHLPVDVPAHLWPAVYTRVIGMQAALPLPAYQRVAQYCSADAVKDANRLQTCTSIAGVLLERGTSLIDHNIGLAIAKRVGWNETRLAQAELKREAYGHAAVSVGRLFEDTRCDGVRQVNEYAQQMGSRGEIAALQQVVERSGRSLESLAAEHRSTAQRLLQQGQQSLESQQAQTGGLAPSMLATR